MKHYLWQNKDWPDLTWSCEKLLRPLSCVRKAQGAVSALLMSLPEEDRAQYCGECLADDITATAAIEGIGLDAKDVSLAVDGTARVNSVIFGKISPTAENLARLHWNAFLEREALSKARLLAWHKALFSGCCLPEAGFWRADAMRVVSGCTKSLRVHFEAPPSGHVDREMQAFLTWFNGESLTLDGVIRAAVAHLRFLTVHPFTDGNGRTARAVTDLALSQDADAPWRSVRLWKTVFENRPDYYANLEAAQKGGTDITDWILWFLAMVQAATDSAFTRLQALHRQTSLWQNFLASGATACQRAVIAKMKKDCEQGAAPFMTTRLYKELTGASRATAWREIEALCAAGILRQTRAGGRSTAYTLVDAEDAGDKKGRSS